MCTLNATKVTDTVAAWLGVDAAGLDGLALQSTAGAGGTTLVPYFDGERTPNRPDASGAFTGLRTTTGRVDIARAAIEGVVCGLLDGLDALTAAGVPTHRDVVLVGGGARSRAFQRAVADLSGRAVVVPEATDLVAAGACAQAAAVLLGRAPDVVARDWNLAVGPTIEPDRNVDHGAIRAAYALARG